MTVLVLAAITMILLALCEMVGTHFLSPHMPVPVIVTLYTELAGITTALDTMLATNYFRVCRNLEEVSLKASVQARGLPPLVNMARLSGLVLLAVEPINALYFWLCPGKLADLFTFNLVPALIFLSQLLVTVALVSHVRRISYIIRSFNVPGDHPTRVLERRLRFWVKVSIVSSCLQVVPGISQSMDKVMSSGPYFFFINILFLKVSKFGNTLAQIQSFAPLKRSSRVTTTGRLRSSHKEGFRSSQ